MSKNVINETFKKHLKLLRKHLNENSPQSQKIDNIFDEFLEKMKDIAAPQVAKTILEQVMSIREQLRKERDLQNFQRLKLLMINQIKELREALGNDKELITAYNEFLNSYVNNKEEQLDEAEGLKQNLEDLLSKMRHNFIDLSVEFGNISGEVSRSVSYAMYSDDFDERFKEIFKSRLQKTRGLINFIQSLEGRLQGYDWVDTESPASYIEEYLRFISEILIKAGNQLDFFTLVNRSDEDKLKVTNGIGNIKKITKDTINTYTEIKKILNTMRVLTEKTKLRLLKNTNVVV